MDNTHQYDDIIHLPHHVSSRHPQMSAAQRAMQFASYKALTGYEEMIEEAGRLTDPRLELDEHQKEELDRTLQQLTARTPQTQRTCAAAPDRTGDSFRPDDDAHAAPDGLSGAPLISVTWFIPDEYKDGGTSRTARGRLKRVDAFQRVLLLASGEEDTSGRYDDGLLRIPIDDIYAIDIL